ncbi:MAG: DUF3990 domain-containing protein [Clostridia bacterium]|nr:DUF3990 domain-containing protein [Clostridia bacterium]
MRLYHTGAVAIPAPDIRHGRANADFGQGFYMTPDADFTYRWAWKDAVVNEYDLALDGLRVRRFDRSAEWFDYIFANRRGRDGLDVDVVVGPIANDTIFDTFGVLSSGFVAPADALELLMIGPEYVQVAVKTDRAAANLRWLGAKTVADVEARRALLRDEKADYSRRFAEHLARVMG